MIIVIITDMTMTSMRTTIALVLTLTMATTLTLTLGQEQPTRLPETIFLPNGQVTLSDNHWLVLFSLNLQPYQEHLNALEKELENFRKGMESRLLEVSNSNYHAFYLPIFEIAERELGRLEIEVMALQQVYQNIRTSFLGETMSNLEAGDLETRKKRSLLGFLSPLLTAIFGIPSEND